MRGQLRSAVPVAAGTAAAQPAASAGGPVVLPVAPDGRGGDCSAFRPGGLFDARRVVRALVDRTRGDVVVQLAGGTYRLDRPLAPTDRDSGQHGHQVIRQAAPVPNDARSRQLYVDGARAPIAQGPAPVVLTRNDGDWTESRCRAGAVSGARLTMQQACWDNVTDRPKPPLQAGAYFPDLASTAMPTRLENASLPHPGQWCTCPFGANAEESANVTWRAAHNVTNTFTHLGAAGLAFAYGSQDNLVRGNVFSDIPGTGPMLGSSNDPHPADVGEIAFVPWDGVDSGASAGHLDRPAHPDLTGSINAGDTTYLEGHQDRTIPKADGSIDEEAGFAHGTRLRFQGNYDADPIAVCPCGDSAIDPQYPGNHQLPLRPGAADLPRDVLAGAGLEPAFRLLAAAGGPKVVSVTPRSGPATGPTGALVIGSGFTTDAAVVTGGGAPQVADTVRVQVDQETYDGSPRANAELAGAEFYDASGTRPGH
ncbi:hypothetical protein [Amycolatopsis saalfeldensis]|uniref:Right handed beta helix region n=1 Tax=Amycolatopsis saalfeldensis TaxID=394193 RepID=A0A1H8VWI6_9PSEU|nr:hypothetical protein [Amycolatopsis saalfeldensis]SEP19759.1 hypothetical protein SAMN04489732_104350 [Amycolatopsis saalfeldensis]